MDVHKKQNSQENDKNESVCINVAFLVCATLTYMIFIVMLTGAQDILAGTSIQTSTVLISDIGPYFLVPLVIPFFATKIPYTVRIVTVVVCEVTAFLILSLVTQVKWKLAAVLLASFGTGLMDTSLVALTSYFRPSVLSLYSTGTGVGFLVGTLYYTGMTTWFCVSPNIALLILGPCSLVYLVCYYFIHREIAKDETKSVTRKEVAYSKLHTSDDENEEYLEQKKNQKFESKDDLTWKVKFHVAKRMLYLVGVPGFVAFVSEYLFFQSVVTTIAYSNAPFPPRDHYQYYSLALMIGEILGRSNRSFLEMVKPSWLYTPTPLLLWVLSAIEFLHLLLFVFESWYRFLPGVGVLIFLCFSAGFIIGLVFANLLEILRISFEGNEREFILTMAIIVPNFGVFTASLMGLFVEPQLKHHCMSVVADTANCFTRANNVKNVITSCKRM